jgi:hypothetical protein
MSSEIHILMSVKSNRQLQEFQDSLSHSRSTTGKQLCEIGQCLMTCTMKHTVAEATSRLHGY